ncbi:MAG: hypothetical protein JWM80_1697 [Cyanobacteria bacterium RYN_339]|nr:hypothetical protein [Cyanobacteria bacterium RYN_339]
MTRFLFASLALVALAACNTGTTPTKPKGSTAPVKSSAPEGKPSLSGVASAPRGTTAGYVILQLAELAVASAAVTTVEGGTSTPRGQTGADGRFEVPGLADGTVVTVEVAVKTPDGKATKLATFARAGQSLAADVDVASTMVARTMVAHGVTAYDPIGYAKAVNALKAKLNNDQLPDWSSDAEVVAKTEEQAASILDLAAVVGSKK